MFTIVLGRFQRERETETMKDRNRDSTSFLIKLDYRTRPLNFDNNLRQRSSFPFSRFLQKKEKNIAIRLFLLCYELTLKGFMRKLHLLLILRSIIAPYPLLHLHH